jgi:hypothetical protein
MKIGNLVSTLLDHHRGWCRELDVVCGVQGTYPARRQWHGGR